MEKIKWKLQRKRKKNTAEMCFTNKQVAYRDLEWPQVSDLHYSP